MPDPTPRPWPACTVGHMPPMRMANCLACRRRDLVCFHARMVEGLRTLAAQPDRYDTATRAAERILGCYMGGLEVQPDDAVAVSVLVASAIVQAGTDDANSQATAWPAWRLAPADLRIEVRRLVSEGHLEAGSAFVDSVLSLEDVGPEVCHD